MYVKKSGLGESSEIYTAMTQKLGLFHPGYWEKA
jgi:hypothetical protein